MCCGAEYKLDDETQVPKKTKLSQEEINKLVNERRKVIEERKVIKK